MAASITDFNKLKKENLELREIITKMTQSDKVFVKEKTELMKSVVKIINNSDCEDNGEDKYYNGEHASCQVTSKSNDKVYYVNHFIASCTWACTCPHFRHRIVNPVAKCVGCKHIRDTSLDDLIFY